ncbi:MAG: LamG domain-containing protein [Flavobacteriales bacterium]|nr:LamG domain-containing protein [Flavobacteriales bacterium]
MELRYTLSFSFLLPLLASAQTQNALDFDGLNDEVTVNNASALVANGTGFSLTTWVYPTHSSNWPDMDGIAGFRDNATFDFYLLQTYGTTLEGRFRNSNNGLFTVDSAALMTLNTWQFIALTYDGATLSMYHNGVLIGAVTATGTVTNTTGQFHIGNMPIPGSTQIYLDGTVDETALWKRGLSQAEIQCVMNYGALPSDPDLKLYFKMDQGTAGGANTGLNTLTDASGHLNGTNVGFALSGTASNYVDGCPIAGTSAATICPGENYTFNGQTLTQSGTYTTGYPLNNGCDSLATLALTVTNVNINVVQNGNNLIAQALGAQFQWLDCGNGYSEIVGATAPSYSLAMAGSYAVEVTQNGCTDTSTCVSNVGLEELGQLASLTALYDASAEELVLSGALADTDLNVLLLDARGRVLRSAMLRGERFRSSLKGLPEGIYLVNVSNGTVQRTFRLPVIR